MNKFIYAAFILLSFAAGCKATNQQKIIGKWKGAGVQNFAASGQQTKTIVETEFTADGKYVQQTLNSTTGLLVADAVGSYKISADSIIWINVEGQELGFKSKIELLSDTKLTYKSKIGDDETTHTLDKMTK
jgi:hypothetical protein